MEELVDLVVGNTECRSEGLDRRFIIRISGGKMR